MSNDDKITELFEVVQLSFQRAEKQPSAARWRSCAQLASVAACSIGLEGDRFRAAALEGVSMEARRRMAEMVPQREEETA